MSWGPAYSTHDSPQFPDAAHSPAEIAPALGRMLLREEEKVVPTPTSHDLRFLKFQYHAHTYLVMTQHSAPMQVDNMRWRLRI